MPYEPPKCHNHSGSNVTITTNTITVITTTAEENNSEYRKIHLTEGHTVRPLVCYTNTAALYIDMPQYYEYMP